jgi:hypothetical protein
MPTETTPQFLESVTRSIVSVGAGRGFLVARRTRRDVYVITAAHCLPHLPPAHPGSYTEERTYPALLGAHGATQGSIAIECVFADPIADLAVLTRADGQAGYDEDDDAFDALIEGCTPFPVGALSGPTDAWLLTLDGTWIACGIRPNEYGPPRSVTLIGAGPGNAGGTSGSPIVTAQGAAVGVISLGSMISGQQSVEQHGQPLLEATLPGWLWADCNKRRLRRLYL